MSEILIIDDDKSRAQQIKGNILSINQDIHESSIELSHSLHSARVNLKNKSYASVFLDMALPTFDDDNNVDVDAGILLLNEMRRGRLNTPIKIFGFTALNDGIEEKNKEFEQLGFKLFYSPPGDLSWLGIITHQLDYSISAFRISTKEKDIAIVTVHGIRTFGSWQERLINLIRNQLKPKLLEPLNFKFTGIDFFTFMIPPLRKKIVYRLHEDLKAWMNEHSTKNIICFSHSFGTYILIKALELFEDEHLTNNISLIVLSGSVLHKDYNFTKLNKVCNATIINECGVNDFPLLLSEAFIIGTGMAGKVGFRRLNTSKFINRYYNGGHSYFFDAESKFIKENWLPLIDGKSELMLSDENIKVNFIQGLLMSTSRVSAKIKITYYIIPLIYVLHLTYNYF